MSRSSVTAQPQFDGPHVRAVPSGPPLRPSREPIRAQAVAIPPVGRFFPAASAATAITTASPIEDLPPVEPVKPLSGSDLIACDYCDAKVRGDEYLEHVASEHAGEAP